MDFVNDALTLWLKEIFESLKAVNWTNDLLKLLKGKFITLEHLSDSFLVELNTILLEKINDFVEIKASWAIDVEVCEQRLNDLILFNLLFTH